MRRDGRTHTKQLLFRDALAGSDVWRSQRIRRQTPRMQDACSLKGFRFLRFDEPLESEFRTRASFSPARVESRRDHRVGLHGARLRDPRSLRALGRAFAHHQHGSLRHARAGGDPHAHLHLEAVLRSLVRLGIAFVAPMFGIGTVIMAAFSPANEVPLIGGRLLLASFFFYFMIGLRLRSAAAREPHRVCRAGGRDSSRARCPRPPLPT